VTDAKDHKGDLAPVVTPFRRDLRPDQGRWIRHFSNVVQGVGDDRQRLYVYHIPPVAQVPISLALAET
jgi:4-hydroxy-tetrahydrodipicolinate synthase